MKTIYLFLTGLILFSACNNSSKKQTTGEEKKDSVETQQDTILTDTTITDLTKLILEQIKNKNYQYLANYIHPQLGIRFSPYGYIDTTKDVVIKVNQLQKFINNKEKIEWGNYDGTGDDIKLTFSEYIDKFVYDVNFLKPEKLTINQSLAKGNSLNNIKDIYPTAEYTESYFSGFKKKYEGMDWRALRLVYKKEGKKYYLVGIIHDQWTI